MARSGSHGTVHAPVSGDHLERIKAVLPWYVIITVGIWLKRFCPHRRVAVERLVLDTVAFLLVPTEDWQ